MASAGIVDAKSVKGADTVGADRRGYDAGKKVERAQRTHIVVDTLGLLDRRCLVTAASLQATRDGGLAASSTARGWRCRRSALVFGPTGGYAGQAVALGRPVLPDRCSRWCGKPRGSDYEVLAAPRLGGWKRNLSWLMRWRRLDRGLHERLPTDSEAMVKSAMIGFMARCLAPPPGRRPWQPADAP